MATAYTDLLRLALPVQGELEGSWGDAVNAQITSMIEQAIAGRVSIALTSTSDVTLSSGNGATDQSRPAILNFTGTPGGAVNIICPTKSKTYVVSNNSNQTITIKTSGGTGQAVTAGTSALVSCDGTNVIASAATTAQGTKADNALPKTGGAMTGAITTNSTFDGVDVAARDAVLTSTTTTANAALPKTGGAMTGAITTNSTFDGVDVAARDAVLTSTTTTANAALPKTGGAMTGAITTNSTFDGVDVAARDAVLTSTTTTANAALPKTGGAMTGAITTNSTFDGVDVAARDAVLTSTTTTANAALPKTTGGNDLTVSTGDAILSPADSNLVIQGAGTTDNYVQFGAGGEFEIAVTGTGAGSRVDLSERNVGVSPLAINGRDVELNTTFESGTVGAGLIVLSGSTSTSIRISSTDPKLTTGGIAEFNANGAGNVGTDWCWMQTGNANRANAPVSAASEAGGVITITLARPLSGNNVPTAGDECALGQEKLFRMLRNDGQSGGLRLYGANVEATGSTVNDYSARVSGGALVLNNPTGSIINIGVLSNTQAITFVNVSQTDATSLMSINTREVAIKGASTTGSSANVKPAALTASPSIVVTTANTITTADMTSYRGKRVVFRGTPSGGSTVALPVVQPTSGSYLGTAFCLLGDTWQITNANTGPRQFVVTVPTNASVIWIKEDGSAPAVITAGNTFTVGRGSVAEIVVIDDTSGATVFTVTGTFIS